jgi:phosphatidylglycerol lysyltransferase
LSGLPRTWVALGDPVGPEERAGDLIRIFLERCDDLGGIPVFYEVGKEQLYRYADFGLTLLKLGEEATVDLRLFTLEGGRGSKNRQALRRLEREGATFRVVASGEVPHVDRLREVSDDWLQHKAAEKGFSLGFFDKVHLPLSVGVVERAGRIEAFANLWPGARNVELSVDLMRYHRDAPHDVMDGLFVHLMQWGKAEGYERFSLGMAPLSGFERSEVAPLWNRLGSFLFEHGGPFYNFQGLRAYKGSSIPNGSRGMVSGRTAPSRFCRRRPGRGRLKV